MPHGPDPQAEARDWITIWQSELAALATDRELAEGWVRLVGLWAEAAERAARLLPGAYDPHGPAGPAAPTRPAAAVAAFDARDATIERLAERVAELERRLTELAAGAGGAGA